MVVESVVSREPTEFILNIYSISCLLYRSSPTKEKIPDEQEKMVFVCLID